MCIVCKEMLPKGEMIRVVKDPQGEFFIDPQGKKSGRGAYICKSEKCIGKCIKTKAVNRNFKTNIDKELYEKIEDEYNRKQ